MNNAFLGFTNKTGLIALNLNHVVKVEYLWNENYPEGEDTVRIHLVTGESIDILHDGENCDAERILQFINRHCPMSRKLWDD